MVAWLADNLYVIAGLFAGVVVVAQRIYEHRGGKPSKLADWLWTIGIGIFFVVALVMTFRES